MEKRSFIVGIALALMLAGTSDGAGTETKHVRCTFSATTLNGVETHIDTNDDTISAGLVQGGVENCTIGRFFFQAVPEFQKPLDVPVTCPAGTVEIRLQQDHGVLTEEKTGDQLFFEEATNAATLCVNPVPPHLPFSFTGVQGTFTGGTGRFAGAGGTFDRQGTGETLISGMKDGVMGSFGHLNGTETW